LLRTSGLAGLAATLLTGCDLDLGASSSTPAAAPTPDPDQHILDAARAELRGLILRLSATGGAAALVACHRTQLAALQGDPPPATQRARPLDPARVAAREHRAARHFAHWATACRNGDLARVLACISAGIRMQPLPGRAG
jgi:hypothetical protein